MNALDDLPFTCGTCGQTMPLRDVTDPEAHPCRKETTDE